MTMTLDDPTAYTKPWVGNKQVFQLQLPKGLTVMYENISVCLRRSRLSTMASGIRRAAIWRIHGR